MQSICLIVLFLLELAVGLLDLDVLLEIRKGIREDPSGKVLVSWDFKSISRNGCPKDWYGVSCSDAHVTSVVLDNLGLVGDFDFHAVARLKVLQKLSISNNQLMGQITEEVGSIDLLQYFDVSSNSFHGSLPAQLTNLRNLMLLNLSLNNFEGSVPLGFEKLEQLKYLDLHSNFLSGDIMHLLCQLGSVEYVDFSSNRFSGSLDLGLANSSFISVIRYFNISHNHLVGELFSHDGMPYFDSLEVFDANNNQFEGKVPSFNFVVSLQILKLGINQLSGFLPEALLQDSSMILSELDLSFNQLEGSVGIITSGTLKKLNLSHNKLSGSLPARVGSCAVIDLSSNMFSGNLSKIQNWGNYVEIIDLSSNSLTGAMPLQTSQFLRLTSLKIANNSISSALPPILGMYPELEVIDLSINQLNGLLLPSLFNSTRLSKLNLSFNNFTGIIPIQPVTAGPSAEFTQNLSLVSLDLSHNALSGQLPPQIGQFHKMVYLDLSNNHLEGAIPDDFPHELNNLNVSHNNLSGLVPEKLRRFPDSAFHPGNSFLFYPHMPSSLDGVPNINLTKHGSHKKSTMHAALVAGLVGSALLIALLILMIYYRAHRWECQRNNLDGNGGKKGIQREASSLPDASAVNKDVDPPLTSFNLPKDPPFSSIIGKPEDNSLILQQYSDVGSTETIRRDKALSSHASLAPFCNPSQSKALHLLESPQSLEVGSPDRLAGVLHLFNSSLVFTAEELSCAPAEIVGRSCHGTLYKAELGSGHVLVVKWLKEGIAKGRKEFAREAKKLGNIKHPNLVSLQGYYWGPKEHEKLIVSNYVNAPSLALYLHETEPGELPTLSFDERLKIAVDVACCLNYLHHERAIPHGNVKSTNILVETPNMTALLTDYSLHRIMTSAGTTDQVLNAAVLGYSPPEFASTSKPCPSLKSDVYAFGVILLELLTGKSASGIISTNSGVVSELTEWVRLLAAENCSLECFDKAILDLHDLERQLKGLDYMLQVALRCILPAAERPDMNTVFEELSLVALGRASVR